VQLQVEGEHHLTGRTTLHFIYWQGLLWNYLKDSCQNLVPKEAEANNFDCAYVPGAEGSGIDVAFVGKVENLPHLARLLLMKALGLSVLTLGPIALILMATLRGAAQARQVAEEKGGAGHCYTSLPDAC